MSQNNLSEVRQTSLDMLNKIFNHGMKYVKHKTVASFFVSIFKPRLDSIIKKEAPEQELIDVMWMVKKDIDPVLKKFDKIEAVMETRQLNDSSAQQKFVEDVILKDVKAFVPKEIKIDEDKAAQILARLRHGA